MAEFTSNYNLKKPSDDDFYNVADFNGNADAVDKELKNQDGRLTKLEAPSFTDVEELKNISAGELLQTMLAKVKKAIASLITHLGAENPHSGSAAKNHTHTAAEITETAEKKVLTAVERTKLAGIATGATKNIVDGEINKDSNNAVSNAAVSAKLSDLTMNDLSMMIYVTKIAEHLSAQGGFSDTANGSSGYLFIGEVLIQWGFTPHSNAAAEKIEQVAITFDSNLKYKTAQYLVFTNTEATNPSIVWATPSNRTVSGFKLNYFCKSTAKSNIYWLTIGRGTRNATEDALPSDS